MSSFEIAYRVVNGNIENGLINDKVRFFMKMFMKRRENESLPHLPWVAEYKEELFRYGCPIKVSIYHLMNAYNRVTKLKIEASIKILLNFLSRANYIAYGTRDEIFAKSNEKDNELKIKVFGSIEDIERFPHTTIKSYDILTLPSGDILKPFIEFYRGYSRHVSGKYIWNIDLWRGEVNPFIGIPYKDMEDFIPNFGRPKLASVIDQLWSHHEPKFTLIEDGNHKNCSHYVDI